MQHLFSVGLFPILLACNQKSKHPDKASEPPQNNQGQLMIPLITKFNGITYRLNLPSVTLIGEEESIELNLIGEEDIQMDLREGTWDMIIGAGWSVQMLTSGKFSKIEASLLHEATQRLLIAKEETTSLLIQVSADQDIITFA